MTFSRRIILAVGVVAVLGATALGLLIFNQNNSQTEEESEWIGYLRVTDPEHRTCLGTCPPMPRYLLSSSFAISPDVAVALVGNIDDSYGDYPVRVSGSMTTRSETFAAWLPEGTEAFQVVSVEEIVPLSDRSLTYFVHEATGAFTQANFPCLATVRSGDEIGTLWNKNYEIQFEDGRPIFVMTLEENPGDIDTSFVKFWIDMSTEKIERIETQPNPFTLCN